jgi:quercetin dioxygenase-like cupin family protein
MTTTDVAGAETGESQQSQPPQRAGDLEIARWATDLGVNGFQLLGVGLDERSLRMADGGATGAALISNGRLGADVIRLAAGEGFVPHTHPGDHLLIVVGGQGTITYGGKVYPTRAGDIYLLAGEVPHAVGAITDHVILAVGSPHRAVDAPDRMKPVAYQAVTTDLGDMTCLICEIHARRPQRLHDAGCPHCPCGECHGS